ncbi:MAG: glycosyltransferase family 2 protein [Lachnospiraceae bacterium]|nr:glycosyltransferase family 2 protein [Lachnospiraceae bacterium]
MKVSVVIPNYNGEKYLKNCVDSLMGQGLRSFEVIVVDDASTDGSAEALKKSWPENGARPRIRYIFHEENKGFAASVNDGIRASEAEFVILLNNDTVVKPGFIENLWREIRRSEKIFSVSASMRKMDDETVMDDGGDLFCVLGWAFSPARDKSAERFKKRKRIFSACGGAAIYRKDVLEKLGGFDEAHFAYLEDVDLGFRAKLAGYDNLYSPEAVVLHAGSGSSGSRYNEFKTRLTVRNQLYLLYKNLPLWMWIVNFQLLAAGWLIKLCFFTVKGLGLTYLKAFFEGFSLCKKEKRAHLEGVPFLRQLGIEAELIANTFRRIV